MSTAKKILLEDYRRLNREIDRRLKAGKLVGARRAYLSSYIHMVLELSWPGITRKDNDEEE